jgi:hypothetical protein
MGGSPDQERASSRGIDRNATLSSMKFFVKAVVTGFGLSLGSALFKKVQHRLGLGEDNAKVPEAVKQDGATDPNLQQRFS